MLNTIAIYYSVLPMHEINQHSFVKAGYSYLHFGIPLMGPDVPLQTK